MDSRRYRLRFLPLFSDDLAEIIDYITLQLNNPEAKRTRVTDPPSHSPSTNEELCPSNLWGAEFVLSAGEAFGEATQDFRASNL